VTDASCYLRPESGGYLYGFFEPDPTSYDLERLPAGFGTADIEEPVEVMREARGRLAPVFPILKELEVAHYKRGLTTFAPDGAYLVGPVSGVRGLFAATGCAALGIAGSAAVGRWLANWVARGDPGEELSSVDPERFGDRAADREWVRKESKAFYGGYYSVDSMSVA
jgi:4-methylaminobutanoate oxidase (formaldehyde-forming)